LVADGVPEAALSESIIARVWGVKACWMGQPGGMALALPA
jgi:iron complex transport system ATP-binding protein